MNKKVLLEKEELIFNDFFKVYKAILQFEKFDGSLSPVVTRLNFRRKDAVAALLYNKDNDSIVLINQFRYPTLEKNTGWITEIVAGVIDGTESPDVAIRREMLEETGYNVLTLEPISLFYSTPGGSSERIHLFMATIDNNCKVNAGGGLENEGEDIEVLEFKNNEIPSLLNNGKIFDAKTLIALQWFMLNKNKNIAT